MVDFLTVADVLMLHAEQVDLYGGEQGVRDLGLLESAVAQPQAGFGGEYLHADLFEMAAAYLFHIVQNHPFLDGNKRAGAVAALVFLDVNGVEIDAPKGRDLRTHDVRRHQPGRQEGDRRVLPPARRLIRAELGHPHDVREHHRSSAIADVARVHGTARWARDPGSPNRSPRSRRASTPRPAAPRPCLARHPSAGCASRVGRRRRCSGASSPYVLQADDVAMDQHPITVGRFMAQPTGDVHRHQTVLRPLS